MRALRPEMLTLILEAAEWRMIDLLFRRPSSEWKIELKTLANEIRDTGLREAARCAIAGASEGTFHSIFGPGGPAPAREASYQGTIQLGYLMSELRAYYSAFGYEPDTGLPGGEPPDHVSVEAGFMSFMRLKQAYLASNDAAPQATIVAEAADRFVQEHLSNIGEPLSFALQHSGEAYLDLAGKALLQRTGPARKQVFDILDEVAASDGCSFARGDHDADCS